ncbi:MAG TPA: hypothetical protein QGG35_05635 [Candidatus Marinimicrobia bacterium]|nr:hypothetical protein [Candidatus Neomarinimicrobiota bacterium]MDP7120934.1 hypothetical protein [Candidatus Neomarinimicrobiota bacterium]MDP7715150.1 hypothetical protein [Candidatus Neomarinimicrobiota bacterium]HJL84868.1 hypothetical protein [Candidatus Neomarinimicrobiota bacterium]HJM11424.1 hypothetical protein [Candidatus Neomarinimicrobiota bacterium]
MGSSVDENDSRQISIKNCILPETLWCDTDQHLWLRPENGGSIHDWTDRHGACSSTTGIRDMRPLPNTP